MSSLVVAIIALGTLAFGAVYPWGYLPLFSVAAVVGVLGLCRSGLRPDRRSLAIWGLILCLTIALQLLPLSPAGLGWLSPHAAGIISGYSLTYTGSASSWHPLSIDPADTLMALIALSALGLYMLGLPTFLEGRALRSMPGRLALFAVPLALFGIYARENDNGLIYWFWRPQEGGGSGQFGPFVNRNHFAGWMLMAVCLLIGGLFGQIERAQPRTGRRQSPVQWLSSAEANGMLLSAAGILIATISLVWTMSRSALLGLGTAAMLFLWLVLRRRRLSQAQRAAVVGMLFAAILVGVFWRGATRLAGWFQDGRDLASRLEAWRDGWELFGEFSWVGTGLNTYPTAMLFYQKRNPDAYVAQAHNDYLQLLAEGGLLVVIPAAIALFFLARAVVHNLRAARPEARGYWIRAGAAIGLVAIAVQEIFEFSLQIPANAMLFCTLAAIALTPSRALTPPVSGARDTIDFPRSSPDVPLS